MATMAKTPFVYVTAFACMTISSVAQLGPGSGPWEVVTPESQGLSTAALEQAENTLSKDVGGRKCFLVVKNGKIVHESYFGSSVNSINTGWSTTKSMCSTMVGIAQQQGWASTNEFVDKSVSNTRKCNREATYKNVLTMTGTSPDINDPRFSYDVLGSACYDTLSAYIQENNPDRLSASDWKNKYFWDVLGYEHSEWSGSDLGCGTGQSTSCRDLARSAQLWLNGGKWPSSSSVDQVVSENFVAEGTTQVFPNAGGDAYGFGVRLRPTDPVDPKVAYFGGIMVQCAFFSKEHQAIVVSMGSDLFNDCQSSVWEQARTAIVSKTHPNYANLSKVSYVATRMKTSQCPNGCPEEVPDWGHRFKMCNDKNSFARPVCVPSAVASSQCEWQFQECSEDTDNVDDNSNHAMQLKSSGHTAFGMVPNGSYCGSYDGIFDHMKIAVVNPTTVNITADIFSVNLGCRDEHFKWYPNNGSIYVPGFFNATDCIGKTMNKFGLDPSTVDVTYVESSDTIEVNAEGTTIDFTKQQCSQNPLVAQL